MPGEPQTDKHTDRDPGERMPNLEHQPLWIKVAALTVAVGGIIALAILYYVRL